MALLVGVVLFAYATNRAVLNNADGKVFSSTQEIPSEPVALVLGTAPRINGFVNPFFSRRISAAADLYNAGKVAKLLVVATTVRRFTMNRPRCVTRWWLRVYQPKRLFSTTRIPHDGFDRPCREIFRVMKCTIVTDDFHLARALYIASERGLDAIAYVSSPVDRHYSTWTFAREAGARSLTWIDMHLTNRQPRYLGKKEPIRI